MKTKTLIFILSVSLLFMAEMNAQYDERDNHPYDFSPGVPPGGDDPDPAPIDDYIPLLIVSGLALAYFVTKVKGKNLNKN